MTDGNKKPAAAAEDREKQAGKKLMTKEFTRHGTAQNTI
tara:strand:+ start:75 stop:191 length:117 start_codon:yes stop_codon:yes gene_type:complete